MLLAGNLEDVMQAVGEEARRHLTKALEDVDGQAGQILQEVLKSTGQGDDPGKAIEEGLQRGIQEGIGGLLDGRRKQEEQKKQDSSSQNSQGE